MGRYRSMDVSDVLAKLGDQSHGLRAARVIELPKADGITAQLPDIIVLAAAGPTTVSTCQVLVPLRDLLIADPNRYYADLGFARPTRAITKKDLRLAYQRCDGSDSQRLTYCFKQLLDPKVRARYDALLPGQIMSDMYTALRLKQEAARWAGRHRMETGEDVVADDFLQHELGIRPEQDKPEKDTDSVTVSSKWSFGFYLWASRKYDDTELSEWQSMLVSAFAAEGLSMQLAVGYCGSTERSWAERIHNDQLIIFLNETQKPDREFAEAAASSIKSQLHLS